MLEKKKIVYACLSHLPMHMNDQKTNINIEELSEVLPTRIQEFGKVRKNYFPVFNKD